MDEGKTIRKAIMTAKAIAKQAGIGARPGLATGGKAQERAEARRHPKTPHHRATTVVKDKGGQWLGGLDDPSRQISRLKDWVTGRGPTNGLQVKEINNPYVDRKGVKYSHGVYGNAGNLISGGFTEADAHREKVRLLDTTPEEKERLFEILNRNEVVNNFIDRQLTKYVKNDMGTAGDPVRALAERGILHVHPDDLAQPGRDSSPSDHVHAGKLGQSEHAKAWEYATDPQVIKARAGDLAHPIFNGRKNIENPNVEINPWLKKIDPETTVHKLAYKFNYEHNHGFNHLADELNNALDPRSGMPHHLMLRPESLARMSVPQAVEHVHNINEWRKASKAEADAAKAKNPATHLYKDYPDTDYAWHELKLPEGDSAFTDTSKQIMKQEYADKGIAPRPDVVEEQRKRDAMEHLDNALKYEGDVMGHCVGGYTNSVASGKTRILSLRNKKTGEPHATVELNREDPNYEDFKKTLSPEDLTVAEAARNSRIQPDDAAREKHKELEQRFQSFRDSAQPSWSINQIKGKGNGALADRYKPFAQDLVRSGSWDNVNDAKNAGLLNVKQKDPYLHRLMTERGDPPPDYMTDSEYSAAKDKHIPEVTKEQGDHLFGNV